MLFEYISTIFGICKWLILKILYINRISYKKIPISNCSFKIAIKKNSKLIIGKNFRSRNNISIRIYNEGILKIGYNCFFNDNCSINVQKKIEIGDNVILGQNVMIFDHDHDYKNNINNFIRKDVSIGNNVWIGANVMILKGVTIGNNVTIAANTVIKENIPDNTMVYQNRINAMKEIKK